MLEFLFVSLRRMIRNEIEWGIRLLTLHFKKFFDAILYMCEGNIQQEDLLSFWCAKNRTILLMWFIKSPIRTSNNWCIKNKWTCLPYLTADRTALYYKNRIEIITGKFLIPNNIKIRRESGKERRILIYEISPLSTRTD